MKRYSIIQKERKCYVCGTTQNIHIHEVVFGKNRNNSIQDGLTVYLCGYHHNQSKEGVHFNHKLDAELKKVAEKIWLEYYNKKIEDFINKYHKNYL